MNARRKRSYSFRVVPPRVVLPRELEAELAQCVTRVSNTVLAALGEGRSATDIHALAAKIRQCVDQALASTICLQKNTSQSLARLPDELWCMIWQELPLAARVAVTQVCRAWRRLANDTPRVWLSLDFFSSLHLRGCLCSDCLSDYASYKVAYRMKRGPPKLWTNLSHVRYGLARSGCLPLTLNLEIRGTDPDEDVLQDFAADLASHRDRIANISIQCQDVSLIHKLLEEFEDFPALRTLSLEALDDVTSVCDFATVPLPALEVLVLNGPWQPVPGDCILPHLRELELPFYAPEPFAASLAAFPALSRLGVQIAVADEDVGQSITETFAVVNSSVSSVADVTVTWMSVACEGLALAMITSARRPRLTLWYAEDVPQDGMRIFADLDRPEALMCRYHALFVELIACDSDGRERTLKFPQKPLSRPLWDHLNGASLTTLGVVWTGWEQVVRGLSSLPSLVVLSLLFEAERPIDPPPRVAEAGDSVCPKLRYISIGGLGGAVTVHAVWLEGFFQSLRLRHDPHIGLLGNASIVD